MTDNHLAAIDRVQGIIAKGDAPAHLEEAKLELQRVVASSEADLEEIAARRKIELLAHAPAAELNRKLEACEKAEKEASRRVQIANAILAEVEKRIDAAREAERSAQRQAAYDAALDLHNAATGKIRAFLNRAAPESVAVMAVYREAEAATAAVNRDLPAGSSPIPSIEAERLGSHLPAKITERRVQWFVHNGNRIAEVGAVEAFPHQGHWVIYRKSNAIQGDETIGPCVIVEYIEEAIRRPVPRPLEALSSSLRLPSFDAPAPDLGRAELRLMPASPVPALAAE
jgi:hypothetical protein